MKPLNEIEKYQSQSFKNLYNINIENTDNDLDEICRSYLSMTDLDRQIVQKSLKENNRFVMVFYAFRCSVRAFMGNPNVLLNGIIALSIENFIQDPRDSIAALSLIIHSSSVLGKDIRPDVNKIIDISSKSTMYYLDKIISGKIMDISRFGFKYVNTETEIGYKWID